MSPPPGPALVEIPTNILYLRDDPVKQRPGARVYEVDDLRAAGKASLINVVGDKRIGHPQLGGNLLGSTRL